MTTKEQAIIRLIIIGDEILSGRRYDKHFSKLIELLGARGLQLGGAQIIPDDLDTIAATLQRSFATPDIVFLLWWDWCDTG